MALGAALAFGGAAAQVVLAQTMADAGQSALLWASLAALVAVGATAIPATGARWLLAGVALVGGTAAWALLPAAWWATVTLLRRENASRGVGWFALGIVLGLAGGWIYFLG